MSVKSNIRYYIQPFGEKFRVHIDGDTASVDMLMSREHLRGLIREAEAALRKSKELKPARDALNASNPPKAGAGQRKKGTRR